MLKAAVPVVSVCAVRTGVGKSALSRHVLKWLAGRGHRVVAVRHPMPYGDLEEQAVQRFATFEDLDRADATIEEREEYEPYRERRGRVRGRRLCPRWAMARSRSGTWRPR